MSYRALLATIWMPTVASSKSVPSPPGESHEGVRSMTPTQPLSARSMLSPIGPEGYADLRALGSCGGPIVWGEVVGPDTMPARGPQPGSRVRPPTASQTSHRGGHGNRPPLRMRASCLCVSSLRIPEGRPAPSWTLRGRGMPRTQECASSPRVLDQDSRLEGRLGHTHGKQSRSGCNAANGTCSL